ncbi:MAG: NADH-quinone oxidoreductase subunit H, partial [Chloroflexi bacterium]|nr:NADH-quinone oxidoreductase subunit H [Chloroflexota bacterium]
VAATLFLGGWQPLLIPLPSYVWFLIKTYFVFFIILWIRGTLPRVRIDQLMAFGWKLLVPLTLANLLLTALLRTILVGQPQSVQIGAFLAANLALFIVTAIIYALATRQKLQPQPTA